MGVKTLDGRLACIAGLVPPCRLAADVGTDHGLLMTYLVETGRVQRGLATDINPGPLEKARRLVACKGLSQRVELRLTDGLAGVSPQGLDAVIIAGMGGELIGEILLAWPYARNPAVTWVLQPMTKAHRLRRTLWDQGFAIQEERCCRAGGRIYTVLLARYAGAPLPYEPWQPYLGAVSPRQPEGRAYLAGESARLRQVADALETGGPQPRARILRRAAQEMERLLEKEEPTP